MGRAVAITESDFVAGKSGLLRNHVDRYPLANLTAVQLNPNPSAMLLSLEFDGIDPKSVSFMFPATAEKELEKIVDLLNGALRRSGKGRAA